MSDAALQLTSHETEILAGAAGPGAALAMRVVARFAEVLGATSLIKVTSAHIDGCGLLSESSLEFAEHLAELGAVVTIPATLSMGPLDLQNWQAWDIPKPFAAKALRQAEAYQKMGCIPCWTCAPYQSYLIPRFGQHVAWGESNAVCYANSVLGARTNRCADFLDICAAIIGRVPRWGLHLNANRLAKIHCELVGFDDTFWHEELHHAALGSLLGRLVGDDVPVLTGLPSEVSNDCLKALGAAAASSGSLAMFHAVGITPEATTFAIATGGATPKNTFQITPEDLAATLEELHTAPRDAKVDQIVLGCPHFSFEQFTQLAEIIASLGEGASAKIPLTVITAATTLLLVQRAGLLPAIEAFGVRITCDTCLFHTPLLPKTTRILMTNSGKCAYYAPGELDVEVCVGTIEQCVLRAEAG